MVTSQTIVADIEIQAETISIKIKVIEKAEIGETERQSKIELNDYGIRTALRY